MRHALKCTIMRHDGDEVDVIERRRKRLAAGGTEEHSPVLADDQGLAIRCDCLTSRGHVRTPLCWGFASPTFCLLGAAVRTASDQIRQKSDNTICPIAIAYYYKYNKPKSIYMYYIYRLRDEWIVVPLVD